jgi:hypothetical protein
VQIITRTDPGGPKIYGPRTLRNTVLYYFVLKIFSQKIK